MNAHKFGQLLLVSLLLFALLTACGSKNTETTTPAATNAAPTVEATQPAAQTGNTPPAAPAEVVVILQNFAFNPNSLIVPVGTTVRFINRDSVAHTVTSDTGAFDSGTLDSGAEFTFTFDQTGTYAYHCRPHRNMTGTITVR